MTASSSSSEPAAPRPKVPRRLIDGVLLLDKPVGLSSNDALIRAKRLLRAKKAGHTGTLDPLASGLLPLCFGEATKFSQDLLDADKTYEATMRLGIRTATGDAEGEAIETREVRCDEAAVREAMTQFVGEIVQVPPMYSALKRDGKPLYEYARAGQVVEREGRQVTILALEMIACALPDVTFRVTCSKGTYVRTLDIGEALGCGAHLVMLRRTGVGALTLNHAVTLDALTAADEAARDAWLQPVDALLSTFPAVTLDAEASRRFTHGQRLPLHELAGDRAQWESAGRVRVYGDDARLLGVAKAANGVLAPERLVVSGAAS
jgi:tRNA pseudouridine55 synthase